MIAKIDVVGSDVFGREARELPFGLNRAARVSSDSGIGREIRFMKDFDGADVLQAIKLPLAEMIAGAGGGDVGDQDIRHSLRSLTYPNGRLVRHARQSGLVSERSISDLSKDAKDLLQVIDSTGQRMAHANVNIMDEPDAEMYSRIAGGSMKPSQLAKFCLENSIEFDQLNAWRVKGGDRRNREVLLQDLGLDTDEFIGAMMSRLFRSKVTVPGSRPVYVPRRDLPDAADFTGGRVELQKQLPSLSGQSNELGERWEASLRLGQEAKHVAQPALAWSTKTDKITHKWIDKTAEHHKQSYSWTRVRDTLDYGEPRINPLKDTVEHTSRLLGACLLLSTLDKNIWLPELHRLHQGKHYKYLRGLQLRRDDVAISALLTQTEYVADRMMYSVAFRRLSDRGQSTAQSAWLHSIDNLSSDRG